MTYAVKILYNNKFASTILVGFLSCIYDKHFLDACDNYLQTFVFGEDLLNVNLMTRFSSHACLGSNILWTGMPS